MAGKSPAAIEKAIKANKEKQAKLKSEETKLRAELKEAKKNAKPAAKPKAAAPKKSPAPKK